MFPPDSPVSAGFKVLEELWNLWDVEPPRFQVTGGMPWKIALQNYQLNKPFIPIKYTASGISL
jgi:hypothetical protein